MSSPERSDGSGFRQNPLGRLERDVQLLYRRSGPAVRIGFFHKVNGVLQALLQCSEHCAGPVCPQLRGMGLRTWVLLT